jgi:hypothetical protein
MESTGRSDPDPQTIAVRIDEVDFTTPRLIYDVHPELMCNRVDALLASETLRTGIASSMHKFYPLTPASPKSDVA